MVTPTDAMIGKGFSMDALWRSGRYTSINTLISPLNSSFSSGQAPSWSLPFPGLSSLDNLLYSQFNPASPLLGQCPTNHECGVNFYGLWYLIWGVLQTTHFMTDIPKAQGDCPGPQQLQDEELDTTD